MPKTMETFHFHGIALICYMIHSKSFHFTILLLLGFLLPEFLSGPGHDDGEDDYDEEEVRNPKKDTGRQDGRVALIFCFCCISICLLIWLVSISFSNFLGAISRGLPAFKSIVHFEVCFKKRKLNFAARESTNVSHFMCFYPNLAVQSQHQP